MNKEKKMKKNGTSATSALRRSPRLSAAKNQRPSTRLSCAKGETPAPNTCLQLPTKRRTQYKTKTDDDDDDDDDEDDWWGDYRGYRTLDEAARAKHFRYYLKKRLHRYQGLFRYGPYKERRTCIFTSGETFSWTEDNSGTTWIALHGTTPYGVIAMDSWPERDDMIHGAGYPPPVHVELRKALVQISVTSSALHERVSQHSQTVPFAVVSVAPGTVDDDQETSSKDYSRAINFLISKLKDRVDLTVEEIVKIGVWALKYLVGLKFQSNQLEAFYYDGVSLDGKKEKFPRSSVDEYLSGFDETSVDDLAAATVNDETTHSAATIDETMADAVSGHMYK